jgi:ATPase subunit of ABC transporter with duplicated ATPase domains
MISIKDVSLCYGTRLLFTDVNLNLNPNSKYALVGGNGAGKSSFLRIIGSAEEATCGEISMPRNTTIGWLKQDQFRYENTSIINTVIAGNEALWGAICEKERILQKMALSDSLTEEDGYALGNAEHIILDNDGYTADILAAELLSGLGIQAELHYENMSILSGGYKLRVLLAQSLFNNPNVLLLDEPTNHLDVVSIAWLEEYLRDSFHGVLVIISHDVAFLNALSTHVLDIDYGEIRQYVGNYSKFVEEKQQILEQKLCEINHLNKKISQMQAFVDKFKASATRGRQAASRVKMIDKIELPDVRKSSRISPSFEFKIRRPSGKVVLDVANVTKSFDGKVVLNKVKFKIHRGDKAIIIGPNGVGKSTLLKILLQDIVGDIAEYEWGHEAQISYFSQDHHALLSENISIIDWMMQKFPDETQNSLRRVLGCVLFSQDDAYKNILNLSGGECARLLLARIMVDMNNIMILDEPTNHLDIEAKEALKQALIRYPGTLIMVTHDRDFASDIATRIIAINPKRVTDFNGTYAEYMKQAL